MFPRGNLGLMHIAAFYDSLEVFLYLVSEGFSLDIKTANDVS